MRVLFAISVLIFINAAAFGHQDREYSLKHNNVHVSIRSGEEIVARARLEMACTLAAKLCETYGYNEPVYIELNYACLQNCMNRYLMSFDDGAINADGETKRFRRKKSILVLRAVNATFNMPALLNLLEYGIQNANSIAQSQQLCDIEFRYQHIFTNSIDTVFLKKIAHTSPSPTVKNVLSTKVQVGKSSRGASVIQYSFHDHGLYVFAKNGRYPDSALLFLKDFWTFYPLSSGDALIFDTDSSFYYVNAGVGSLVSRRHVLYPISCWGSSCVDAHWENRYLLRISYTAASSPIGAAFYKMGYYPASDSMVMLRSYRKHH